MVAKTVVFAGDSITAATHLLPPVGNEVYTGFAQRTQTTLPSAFPSITWNIYNEGVNGTCTRDWAGWINSKILNHSPNIVVIMLGTNDAAPSNFSYSVPINTFESNLRAIINSITATGAKVILMTPPPYDENKETFTRINSSVATYAQKVRDIAASLSVDLIDNYNSIYQYHGQPSIFNTYFFSSDGIHLSDIGHQTIFNMLYPNIVTSLGISPTVSTPVVTRTGNILTALSTTTNTTQPIGYYWGTDGINFPNLMQNGVYDFTGLSGTVKIRAQVIDGQAYYSNVANFNLPTNYLAILQPDLTMLTLPLFYNVQGYIVPGTNQILKVVEPADPEASSIITKWFDGTIKAIAKG